MKAARALLEMSNMGCYSCISFVAREDGWMDFYTYEPLGNLVHDTLKVTMAMEKFWTDVNCQWEWRLFGPEGSVYCYSNGNHLDEDDCPIEGTNALADKLQAILDNTEP